MGSKRILYTAFALLSVECSLISAVSNSHFWWSTLDALRKRRKNSILGLGVDLWLLCNQTLAQHAFFYRLETKRQCSSSHVVQPADVLCDLHLTSQLLCVFSLWKASTLFESHVWGGAPPTPTVETWKKGAQLHSRFRPRSVVTLQHSNGAACLSDCTGSN